MSRAPTERYIMSVPTESFLSGQQREFIVKFVTFMVIVLWMTVKFGSGWECSRTGVLICMKSRALADLLWFRKTCFVMRATKFGFQCYQLILNMFQGPFCTLLFRRIWIMEDSVFGWFQNNFLIITHTAKKRYRFWLNNVSKEMHCWTTIFQDMRIWCLTSILNKATVDGIATHNVANRTESQNDNFNTYDQTNCTFGHKWDFVSFVMPRDSIINLCAHSMTMKTLRGDHTKLSACQLSTGLMLIHDDARSHVSA